MVRGDVRKDNQGFEDIDEFWADDDDFDATNDDDDDEYNETSMSERDLSSANVSMGSLTSERQVRLSGVSTQSNDFEFGNDGNISTDTMDLEEEDNVPLGQIVAKSNGKKKAAAPTSTGALATPSTAATRPKSPRFSKFSTASSPALSHDFNVSHSFDTGSAMKAIPIPAKRGKSDLVDVKRLIARKSLPNTKADDGSATKSNRKKSRRDDSFGEGAGFGEVNSPFSLGGDPVTPLSNASERNLDSIKFSDKESANSPNIRVKLFKNDDDRVEKEKKTKSKASAVKKTPPTKRQKTAYKSTPTSDDSMDQQTDNDNTFNASSEDDNDDTLSHVDDESDTEGPRRKKKKSRARERDLSYAQDILDDAGNDNASGVRRSKRKRFKPLAWYKGEHYVYERRESGVGLVIPTVAGIERVGTTTPTKTARKYTKKSHSNPQRKAIKPFPKSSLPKGLKYEDGEWADLYDTSAGCINKMNVICRASEIEHRELPSVDGEVPGFAGQSFNLRNSHPFSRWICGRLGLPPGAAKEAESVGEAVQVFYVTNCQPGAVEVSFGPVTDEYFDTTKATRFLLNPGDEFYVPSRNAYYLKNYSEKATCDLHFTIMKPDLPATVVSSTAETSPSTSDKKENARAKSKAQKRLKP
uniref:Mif2/CENP-C cupin domain-containing protein n=1 Tax=Globisporangium ultimum (strain ATCC 200006 / CBS 805.95 / DAOM BR144) TaxID=431595 RepID=K3WQF2_GLOUD